MDWKTDNCRAMGILRVSSIGQKDNTSHGVQRHEIDAYVSSNGLKLAKVFEIVESAKNSDDRKQYHSAIKWALDNDVRHILFYMFDREARNLTDNEDNEILVRQNRIVLHYVRDRKVLFKNSPDSDFLMRDFHAIQNKQYSRNLSVKVRDSMRVKAESGWYPSNIPPLGYVPEATLNEEGKERRRGKIVGLDPNTKKREQVIREFELRAKGFSFRQIKRKIIEEGLIPTNKQNSYHVSSIENRIKHVFYRGKFYWEGKIYNGKHQLFIPPDILDAVDRTLGKKSWAVKPVTDENALGGGWLKCGAENCGCNIVHEKKTKRPKNKEPKVFHYYHCTNGRKIHTNMKGLNIPENRIWSQLGSAIESISISEEFAEQISEALNDVHLKTRNATIREMDAFKQGIENSHVREDEIYRDFKCGVISEDFYRRQIDQVRSERMRFTEHLKQAQLTISDTGMETAKSILELSMSAKSLWENRTPLERREFLNEILSNPVLDGVNIRYEMKKPFRVLSEMSKSVEWRGRVDNFITECLVCAA